ncbi:MFS transporter [Nocardia sp. NBC_00565]|uniref:MFS transporter n=1 Tax=Nocardia sp. NBC_00565 TaxID=2975993 RepID=UPI002E80D316|nr:MFS transporter [Nocardia sp. NBC_00565]WUC07700.1 MFS transporter [Nocardia sp. NBC_00565]
MDAVSHPGGGRLFLPGQAVSLFGDGLAVLAIPLLVLQSTHNPTAAALAAAPRTVGYLIAGLPAGPLVDRADPWHVLIAADAVRSAIFVALFGLAATRVAPVGVILALAFAAGVAGVFFETALAVAVRDVYRDRALVRTNSFLETASRTALLIGPAAVGLLTAAVGLATALLVDAATFLVSLATLWGTYRRMPRRVRHLAPMSWRLLRSEFRAGLRYLAATSIMTALAVLQVVTNFCLAVETLIVFFARDYLGASAGSVGIVVAGAGVGGILGAAIAPAIAFRFRPVPLCLLAVLLIGVALAAAGLAPGIWWLAASNAVLVAADVLGGIVIRTLRQQIVPREVLGRVTSTVRSVVLAAMPVGAVAAGLVTQLADNNPRPVFLAAAALIWLSAPVIWITGLHRHRGVPLYRPDRELVTP